MNGQRSQRMFFMELIFVLLSFALCTAVCVKLFAQAHQGSVRSRETSAASVRVQESAEAFKAMPNDIPAVAHMIGANSQGDRVVAYYDDTWHAVSQQSLRCLTLEIKKDGALITAEIKATLRGDVLFSLTVCRAVIGKALP